MAQYIALDNVMLEYPFTWEEVFLAFSLVFPREKAQELADAVTRSGSDAGESSTGWMIPVETLMLYSIVSPDLDAKVNDFIRRYWPSLDMEEWRRKRDELRRHIESGDVVPDAFG